ncbi:hypothetical protein [Micromonospora luteifusca]|uniref:hypothetical protein n=1 Tax=Micromonospora luteifusca TaxID=709860 RepID=UPI0033B30A14
MAATIAILQPTLCIVQGVEVYKSLTAIMSDGRQIAPHLVQARIAGVNTLVAAFNHPSATRLADHWGRLTSVPYLFGTVAPTLRAAHQLMTAPDVQDSKPVGPQRRPKDVNLHPPR